MVLVMKVGCYDDNKEYNCFFFFFGDNCYFIVYFVNVNEWIVIKVIDKVGKSLYNCDVFISLICGWYLVKGVIYVDGIIYFFLLDSGK